MNAIHGWPSEIRPAGQTYPVSTVPTGGDVVSNGQLGANQVPPAIYNPDVVASQFLGRAGFSCATWERLSLGQKRDEVYYFLHARQTKREAGANVQGYMLKRGVNNFGPTDSFIHAVDAHCLKLAINSIRRAGQTQVPKPSAPAPGTLTSMATPIRSGLIGLAVGVAVGALGMHLYMR